MKIVCEFCGGAGQISYFKGVSRFLLSCEECSECSGLGYVLFSGKEDEPDKKQKRPARKKKG